MLDQLTGLREISMASNVEPAFMEEALKKQKQAIEAVQHDHPQLRNVAFQYNVRWSSDVPGQWTAALQEGMGRTTIVATVSDQRSELFRPGTISSCPDH